MSFVYFIQAGGARGHVKIGYSKNVEKRLDAIRTSNPASLKILHQANHGEDAPLAEKALHEIFADTRIGASEWFRWSADIKAVIVALRKIEAKLDGAPVPAAFDIVWNNGNAEIVPIIDADRPTYHITANGIGVSFGQNDLPDEEQIATCAQWLRSRSAPCSRLLLTESSYSLKHRAERDMGSYVSNGALLEACVRSGIRIHRCDETSPNAWVGLRLREVE